MRSIDSPLTPTWVASEVRSLSCVSSGGGAGPSPPAGNPPKASSRPQSTRTQGRTTVAQSHRTALDASISHAGAWEARTA
jgi:hypothetical protein